MIEQQLQGNFGSPIVYTSPTGVAYPLKLIDFDMCTAFSRRTYLQKLDDWLAERKYYSDAENTQRRAAIVTAYDTGAYNLEKLIKVDDTTNPLQSPAFQVGAMIFQVSDNEMFQLTRDDPDGIKNTLALVIQASFPSAKDGANEENASPNHKRRR